MNKREKRIIRLSAAGSISMVVLLLLSGAYMTPTVKGISEISVPYTIAGTDLMLLQLTGYEGPYLEDGTMEEVVDVAAAVICNTGTSDLAGVKLSVSYPGGSYRFRGYDIPAGATVTLLELDRKRFQWQTITSCYGVSWPTNRENRLEAVLCREISMDTVEVINTSAASWEGLELCYKNTLPELDWLIGGVTHRIRLPMLPPGAAVQVYLPNYLSEYSKIIRIE